MAWLAYPRDTLVDGLDGGRLQEDGTQGFILHGAYHPLYLSLGPAIQLRGLAHLSGPPQSADGAASPPLSAAR